MGLMTAFIGRVPLRFTTRHNVNYYSGIKKILLPLDALSLRLSTTVVAISNAVKNFYENSIWYKGVNFQVIYNGIDLDRFFKIKRKERNNASLYFLTVASLTPKKGHLQFLEILKNLKELEYEWHLVGDGPEKPHIEDRARELGLEKNIIFHGVRKDVENFYQEADLFILPSLWEGFGLVLIEAMAAGVPVFASDVDGVKEIVKDGKNGVLFNYLKNDNAERLRAVVDNKGLIKSLSNQGMVESEKFSIEEMKNNYLIVYKINFKNF